MVGSTGALTAGIAATLLVVLIALALAGASRRTARRQARRHGLDSARSRCRFAHALTLSPRPEEMRSHVRAALTHIGARIESETAMGPATRFQARTGTGGRSFGQAIRIDIGATPAGRSGLRIECRPARTQLFDGGASARSLARLVQELTTRAAIAGRAAVAPVAEPPADETRLRVVDGAAFGYLFLVVVYTGGTIWLAHHRDALFEAFVAATAGLPLDPVRLLGDRCTQVGVGLDMRIDRQIDLITLPTFLFYGLFNLVDFRAGRERMDGLDWLLAVVAIVVLPALFATGCDARWRAELLTHAPGLSSLLVHFGLAGILHAAFLLIFLNALSFLPAALLARIFQSRPPKPG